MTLISGVVSEQNSRYQGKVGGYGRRLAENEALHLAKNPNDRDYTFQLNEEPDVIAEAQALTEKGYDDVFGYATTYLKDIAGKDGQLDKREFTKFLYEQIQASLTKKGELEDGVDKFAYGVAKLYMGATGQIRRIVNAYFQAVDAVEKDGKISAVELAASELLKVDPMGFLRNVNLSNRKLREEADQMLLDLADGVESKFDGYQTKAERDLVEDAFFTQHGDVGAALVRGIAENHELEQRFKDFQSRRLLEAKTGESASSL